jgi:hypothetical protein
MSDRADQQEIQAVTEILTTDKQDKLDEDRQVETRI